VGVDRIYHDHLIIVGDQGCQADYLSSGFSGSEFVVVTLRGELPLEVIVSSGHQVWLKVQIHLISSGTSPSSSR
jgi:hypothetical protein